MYYSGKFEVELADKKVISFKYDFDNEICPEIVVPKNWKDMCNDEKSIVQLLDFLLRDPYYDDEEYEGLRSFMESFDECVPFEEMKCGPEFDSFLNKVKEKCGSIRKITVSVIDENGNIDDQKILDC